MPIRVGIVSCDIVGHSAVRDLAVQRRRAEAINGIARSAIETRRDGETIWASGGDGGHLLFCEDHWLPTAIDYMTKLREWATKENVKLRITGHVGEIDRFSGADGRSDCVGDGINLAGWLLEHGFDEGVLVSQTFKDAVEHESGLTVSVHDRRVVLPRHFPPMNAYLLSRPGIFDSRWNVPDRGDRDFIEQAIEQGRAWRAIYYAKRLFQSNTGDDQAEEILDQLGPHELVYRSRDGESEGRDRVLPNPFFSGLDAGARRHAVRSAQLVERKRSELLCQAGDPGDTMFIVLDGSIGVFLPDTRETIPTPVYVAGPGEIVGELAFTLQRPRTAALAAMEDSSLLSVHAGALKSQARSNPAVAVSIDRFLTSRILEFVCCSLSYLVGKDKSGPLVAESRRPVWDRILVHTERIDIPLADPRSVSMSDQRFLGDGLYILVSGKLRSVAHPDKVLVGTDLPLVFVDLPGRTVCPNHEYRPEGSDATILRIGTEALLGRRPAIDQVASKLGRELAKLYHFDVFLSYTFDDLDQAKGWQKGLESAGLRVYMETSTTGHYFRDRIASGVLDSLTLVALVSANTMSRPLDKNWVRAEIDYRKSAFEAKSAKIVPVRLKGGQPEMLADGYTVIESIGREEAALAEVVHAVQRARQGLDAAPFALVRKTDVKLGMGH